MNRPRWLMVAIIVAAMASDLLTFAIGVERVGIEAEANPLMSAGYQLAGPLMVAAIKAMGTLVIVALLFRVHRRPMQWLAVAVGVSITLAGTTANIVNGVLA